MARLSLLWLAWRTLLSRLTLLPGFPRLTRFPWLTRVALVVRRLRAGFKSGNHGLVHRAPQQLFNLVQQRDFLGRHQGNRFSRAARAPRATDAMHVVFGHMRQIVVDHMRQFFNIQTARGEVGSHQHAHHAGLEIGECLSACALALVAVNRRGGNTRASQLVRETIGAVLCAGKHQHLFPVAGFHQVREQRALARLTDGMHTLRHQLGFGIAPRDFHHYRFGQQAIRQFANLVGKRRREQQVLPLRGQQGEDALDVVNKTHIEHAVGFIQHENFHVRQIHRLLIGVIQQAARCRHQNIHACLQRLNLRPDTDTTEYHGGAQRQIFAVGMHAFFDLRGKLTRGGHDQRTHRIGARIRRIFHQALQQRQRKAGGFAGARLRAGEDIAAFENNGNRLHLHRRGLGITMIGGGAHQIRHQAEIGK